MGSFYDTNKRPTQPGEFGGQTVSTAVECAAIVTAAITLMKRHLRYLDFDAASAANVARSVHHTLRIKDTVVIHNNDLQLLCLTRGGQWMTIEQVQFKQHRTLVNIEQIMSEHLNPLLLTDAILGRLGLLCQQAAKKREAARAYSKKEELGAIGAKVRSLFTYKSR